MLGDSAWSDPRPSASGPRADARSTASGSTPAETPYLRLATRSISLAARRNDTLTEPISTKHESPAHTTDGCLTPSIDRESPLSAHRSSRTALGHHWLVTGWARRRFLASALPSTPQACAEGLRAPAVMAPHASRPDQSAWRAVALGRRRLR